MKTNIRKTAGFVFVLASVLALGACGENNDSNPVKDIIAQAEAMDEDALYAKAAEEINGKKFVVVANSSRMKDAFPAWVKYVAEKEYAPKDFSASFETTQPKNNQIFSQIKGDVTGASHNISMTLIQDGSQIASKMTKPGYLLNYIPKEWKGSKENDGQPLALQSLSKVFCYNTLGADGTVDGNKDMVNNVFDFVLNDKGEKFSTQFMAPTSEPVGQNMMYMLTRDDYAAVVKEAYNAATTEQKAAVDKVLEDGNAGIKQLMVDGGFNDDAKYSLAWTYLWMKSYTKVDDDGPISVNLTKKTSGGTAGLLVYSKFRSIKDTADVSKKPIQVAAYKDGYVGFGGYMYKHYLQILKTSPFPWTSCAFIHFMTNHAEGFQPWGKDMGGYSANPEVQKNFDHSKDGYKEDDGTEKTEVVYPVKNDKGYDWWTANEAGKGRLVLEDGEYCSKVAAVMNDWIAYL
ncbi:MAG TPA: hypothetical protein DDW20_01220 [Firmicutes bacterium]|nr:hypothetical protein [Bacillota bacterium]